MRSEGLFRWLSLLAVGLVAAGGVLADATSERSDSPVIDAENMHIEQEDGDAVFHAEGNVVIRYLDAVVSADRARFNTRTKEARAEGNVRLLKNGQEWVAPTAQYNFQTGQLIMPELGGLVDPLFIRGEGIQQVDTNRYTVARGTVSTCDYPHPHYRLEATRSEVLPDRRLIMYNVTLRFGSVPVFWFPALVWSLDGDIQPLTVSLGSGSNWGFYALVSSHWQLNPNTRLTVHVDGRTERGIGGGADLDYRLGDRGEGTFKSYYINDRDPLDKADQLAGRTIPSDRYRVQLRHRQSFWEDLDLKLDLNHQSDRDVVDDFFPSEFRHEREPQTVADLTRRGDNHTISVLARPQLNNFFAEVERLPEVTWTVNRMRVGPTPLFYEQETRVGYLRNHAGDPRDPLFVGEALRAHTMQQLLIPGQWFGWLSVVPRAGIGGSYYSSSPASSRDGDETRRAIHTLGVDTSFKLSRTWNDARFRPLGVRGLRHIVQPFANFNWVPSPDNTSDELYQFDTVREVTLYNGDRLSVTRYAPLEFPSFNTLDAIDEQQLVRFGLAQKLQTQREGQPWDLLELEAWTDYRLERDPGEDDFSDIYGVLRLRPFRWFAMDSFARYDLQDGVVREFNGEARLVRDDRWSLGVGTRWLKDDSNLVGFSAATRLGRRWLAQTYQRVDLEDGVWESQEYALRQETHDWLITYGVRYLTERIKQDEFVVFFAVTLKAFPEAGLQVGGIGVGEN